MCAHSHINTDIMLSATTKLPGELVAAAAQATLYSTLRPRLDSCLVDAADHSGSFTSGMAQLQEPTEIILSSSSNKIVYASRDDSSSSSSPAGWQNCWAW
eukprot:GHRR01014967.1.p4 GENE.GHRR01014967.1~~GHRR01014967.1.p4  ORF type:complete len:100 (+),score=47.18 GHRR01014967.1:856-1155(+)